MIEKIDLSALRRQIDEIDDTILGLLNKRAAIAIAVGETKNNASRDIYVPERERDIFERLTGANPGPFPNHGVLNVFREIISGSRSLEKVMKVAFLGPEATFTHQACMSQFGRSTDFIAKGDIADVFDDVERGAVDFGVVPVENSTGGVVSHTLDMFVESGLKIYAEILLPISLCLMNKSGDINDVKTVASHSNPISQSKGWIKKTLPQAVVLELSSTALAAEVASKDATTAAIASEAAAEAYGLKVLERRVEDNLNNVTRFLVIGKKEAKISGNDKTSIMFAADDKAGALFSIIKPLADIGINLTKIESRPVKKKAWEYIFYIDMDGHISDPALSDAVSKLKERCSFFKILGSYPKASNLDEDI